MLASPTSPTRRPWFSRFQQNSTNIPSTIMHYSDTFLKPKKLRKNASLITRLYQIVFDAINGIPVPNVVLQKASQLNANIGCRLSMSLFDLESAAFVGKTWHSPYAIPVVKNIDQLEDSDGDDDETTSPALGGIDMLRAHLVGNKLNVKLKHQVL